MDKKQIKQLLKLSITDNKLDHQKVELISNHLSRSELKIYLKSLKKWIRENTVIIEVPRNTNITDQIKNEFKGKEIIIKENPSLLLGLRIQENDDVYEISLSNTLFQMEKYLLNYDK